MKPSVYIETSIISYVASRPSRDLIIASNQQLSHEWWHNHRGRFDTYISQVVIDECSQGDPVAAHERLDLLKGIPDVVIDAEGRKLAKRLIDFVPFPGKAHTDALHIAVSAVNGIEYLLTWNCKHIANATLQKRIIQTCESAGLATPTICTPQEILEL
jgi:hypothetical protein